jgi:hypothetical protein
VLAFLDLPSWTSTDSTQEKFHRLLGILDRSQVEYVDGHDALCWTINTFPRLRVLTCSFWGSQEGKRLHDHIAGNTRLERVDLHGGFSEGFEVSDVNMLSMTGDNDAEMRLKFIGSKVWLNNKELNDWRLKPYIEAASHMMLERSGTMTLTCSELQVKLSCGIK